MIESFIPLDDDGTSTTREKIRKDFLVSIYIGSLCSLELCSHFFYLPGLLYTNQNFHARQGDWLFRLNKPLPEEVSGEELSINNKKITLEEVIEWIEKNDGIDGRFVWYKAFASTTDLYRKIARPLLSMGTVGSINTERSAKGLKHDILSLKHNRLWDDQAIILYRCGENLRNLLRVRMQIVDRVGNSILGRK